MSDVLVNGVRGGLSIIRSMPREVKGTWLWRVTPQAETILLRAHCPRGKQTKVRSHPWWQGKKEEKITLCTSLIGRGKRLLSAAQRAHSRP